MRKAIIIMGSPRKKSNTFILAKEAQRGLTDSGAASQIFLLNDMNIKGCQACYYCKTNNTLKCAVQDDMQTIYKAMEDADGIIVATPIYFSDVTAQTKTWLDRLFPYINIKANSIIPASKKASFIFTQNQPNPYLFLEHTKTFRNMLSMIGFEEKDSLLAYDLDKGYKPMVTERKGFLQKAYELGKELFVF